MNAFTDIETTKFSANLISSVESKGSPFEKAASAVALLNLYLDANSYVHATSVDQRRTWIKHEGDLVPLFDVPYPIFIAVEDENSQLVLGEVSPAYRKAAGESRILINQKYSLRISGADMLFKKRPQLQELSESVAAYLMNAIGSDKLLQSDKPDKPSVTPNDPPIPNRFFKWSPMAEAYGLLADAVQRFHLDRTRLRWAWISLKRPAGRRKPYIFLQPTGKDTHPRIMNEDGSTGIIHGVLERQAPKLLWNYARNPDWRLAQEIRQEFIIEAEADKFPHMIYFPVLDRLAAQITFSPDDDLLKLLAAGRSLVELAPVTLVSGFQQTIFNSMLDLFAELRANEGRSKSAEIENLLIWAIDACPVPAMKLLRDKKVFFQFKPDSGGSPIAEAFAEQANTAIKHAYDNIQKRAETEDYKLFGANVMGMTHTISRPIHNMKSYVETVANLENLPRRVAERSTEMIAILNGVEVFAKLEISAFKEVFPSRRPKISTANDVISVLSAAKYSSELSATGSPPFELQNISDPIHGAAVAITVSKATRYLSAPGPFALIIAELIDNAAKHRAPDAGPIRLDFRRDTIVVTNSITDRRDVEATLSAARESLGKSLNRIYHVAHMIGYSVDTEFPSPNSLEFTIRPNNTS